MKPSRKQAFHRVDTPRNVNRVIPLIKIRATDSPVYAICSINVWGYVTHWNGKRTVLCSSHLGRCPYCTPDFSTRDKGLILVANTVGQLHGFLELTPQAFAATVLLSKTLQGLRGKLIQVRREHGSMKGRLLVEYVGDYTGAEKLPADKDPEPTLRRIHGLSEMD